MNEDPDFLKQSDDVLKHGGKLPHWQQGQVAIFVTFRLADSLPAEILVKLRELKEAWLKNHGGEWTPEVKEAWKYELADRMDAALDAGHGCCCLRREDMRAEVVKTLQFGDGERYQLHAAVVMPNHVHVLFSPGEALLADEVKAWKSVSSRRLKKGWGDHWPGWQKNYFDRLIRSRVHFERTRRYILENGRLLRDSDYWVYGGAMPPSHDLSGESHSPAD